MLGTLLESRKHSPRRRPAIVLSGIAHFVLLIGLVMTRAQGTSDGLSKPVATSVVYIAPPVQQPPQIPPRTQVNPSSPSVDFPTLPALTLKPLQFDGPDPTRSIGPIVPAFPTTASALTRDTAAPVGRVDDIMTAMTVDQQVQFVPGQRPPRYPSTLERAGISGDVVAQFVVDTTGRVERGSVEIQHATHPDFARAVEDRLVALRFVPASARGRVVRQLVEQRFHFEVVRR